MPINPTFTKIYEPVASHAVMIELLNRPVEAAAGDPASGAAWAGQWFEITEQTYDAMLDVLPPLFMRDDMFAPSEMKAGTVGPVFFAIGIAGQTRWFHGYCDLTDRRAPDRMRAAIILSETGDTTGMTRAQKLDAIWSFKHRDFKGIAGAVNADAWPPEHL